MKVIVSQYGARRRYLIPQILQSAGILSYLYTDSYKDSYLGKIALLFSKIKLHNTALFRLLKRTPNIPKKKIKANDLLQLKLLFLKLTRSSQEKIINCIFEGNSKAFIRWGCNNIDWLYAMYLETFDFTEYAKKRGVKILVDIYENPYIFKELAEEIELLPELRCIRYLKNDYLIQYNLRLKYIDKLLNIADQYLIPSEYVKNALEEKSPSFNAKKANIIPYVSSVTNTIYNNKPIKGRIIWIGNDLVRKGLVYSLRAINILKERYPFIDFRIIGPMPKEILHSDYFKNANFIGYLNKEQLQVEFIKADIYIFPTLAEGFAGSLLEAASFGVPIITTRASGFGNDFPGLFIKEKNVDDIVNAISLLLEDRNQRLKISKKLFEYSQKYDKDSFKKNLLNLLYSK